MGYTLYLVGTHALTAYASIHPRFPFCLLCIYFALMSMYFTLLLQCKGLAVLLDHQAVCMGSITDVAAVRLTRMSIELRK